MWSIGIVTGWLMVCAVMDMKTRRIPVWMLVLGGVLATWAACCRHGGFPEAVWGMLPGVFLLLLAFVTHKAGYGDGIVLGCLGMVLGGESSLLLLGISLFLASLCALVLLVMRRVGRNTSLAFVPFLAASWLVVISL